MKGGARRVTEVISRLTESESVVARRDGTFHRIFPFAVHPREAEVLEEWVKREDAASTVEIGLGYGLSTLFICRGLLANGHESARHVALDPNQTRGFSACGLQAIDEAGLGAMVEFHEEASETGLPRLLVQGRSFDLAFIDGNHRFEFVFLDLMYLGRLVRPGKVVFLDDYQLPSIKKAVRFCTTNLEWALEEERVADDFHHWAVLRTPAVPLERTFDHFVDF